MEPSVIVFFILQDVVCYDVDEEALDAAAAAPPAVQQPQGEGPPPLLVARQAAQGLGPDQEQQHDRQHSGEHTSTSVGVFELINKSVSTPCSLPGLASCA